MKQKSILNLLIVSFFLLAMASCKKFDAINTDPLAASADQVQVEYFIQKSIIGAQMDPHIAERIYVLYWKTASRQQMAGGLSFGGDNDGWSSDYWSGTWGSKWLNAINTAVQVGEEQVAKGTSKLYTQNLIQVARIWRTVLMAEFADTFGPIAIEGFKGVNPEYNSLKEVYYYLLSELKDATAKLDVSVESPSILNKADIAFSYKYDWAKWKKFGNSLRMRYAMRISEVDAAKAKAEFEEAVAGSNIILDAASTFDVLEGGGYDDLTGVMTREWNLQPLSATLNNIYTNLGGVSSANLLPTELQSAIKPAGYIGLKFPDFYTDKTNDPTVGYWLDGLPNIIDPRAYKAFIIPGWFSNPNYCYYPSWTDDARTQIKEVRDTGRNGALMKTINATYTWNTTTTGDWGFKGTRMSGIRGNSGTTPTLSLKFRNGTSKRIFFAPWETYFLIAEAAVKGWTVPISGKAAYEAGIKSNFEYWGVESHLSTYLASTTFSHTGTSVSWDHVTEPPATHTMTFNDGMTGTPGTVAIKYPVNNLYKGGAIKNDHLTKVITQKYIAHLPWAPLEAWNDKRRLGLPFFENPAIENPAPNLPDLTLSSFMTSNVKFFPQRVRYPTSLRIGSPKGYEQAVAHLGGPDAVLTPLWWALKP